MNEMKVEKTNFKTFPIPINNRLKIVFKKVHHSVKLFRNKRRKLKFTQAGGIWN